MAKEIRDDDLATMVQRELANSEDYSDTKLRAERRKVEAYYRKEAPKPLHKGDSHYVSGDVFEAVDSMRSSVVETFSAHQRIVYFAPEANDTIDDAKQATEYTRHVFYKKNDGSRILYDVAGEGLKNRFSVVKVTPDVETHEEEFDFENLTEDELTEFTMDEEDYEFTNIDKKAKKMGLFTGTLVSKKSKKKVKVEVLPPEDFIIRARSTSIKDADFCAHRAEKSKKDLIAEGFDRKMVEQITFENHRPSDSDIEKTTRFSPVGSTYAGMDDDDGNDDLKFFVYECYYRVDMDGTGVKSLWKVIMAGDTILDKERVRHKPFAVFIPLPTAHTFFGDNFAASMIPTQNTRTVLQRQIINHAVHTNSLKKLVLNGTLNNPSELLDKRFGGIVNVKRMDGIAPEPQAPLNPYVFNLIQMLDADKEEMTGQSKLSKGLDKNAVSSQNSEGMVDKLMDASQQRQKTIARQFGEFVRDVFGLIYATAIDYIDEDDFVSVTGQYVPVNPNQWINRSAATVELTLGYGEREAEAQKYIELDQYFSKDPQLAGAYGPEKRWQVLSRATERMGIEDLSTLLTPPQEIKPKEPTEADKLELEQRKAQVDYLKAQTQAMISKGETDKMNAQANLLKVQNNIKDDQAKFNLSVREQDHNEYVDEQELTLAKQAEDQRAIFSADG